MPDLVDDPDTDPEMPPLKEHSVATTPVSSAPSTPRDDDLPEKKLIRINNQQLLTDPKMPQLYPRVAATMEKNYPQLARKLAKEYPATDADRVATTFISMLGPKVQGPAPKRAKKK